MKLNLGCDDNYLHARGWVDVDLAPSAAHVVHSDARTLPNFDDGCASFVFCSHLIEHMPYEDGVRLLKTCFRVLRPGGRLRVSTPDLMFLARLADGNMGPAMRREYIAFQHKADPVNVPKASACHVVNRFVRGWGHCFIFDDATLREAMSGAGFTDLRRYACGKSNDPELCDLEPVGRLPPGMFQLESMTYEGVRP